MRLTDLVTPFHWVYNASDSLLRRCREHPMVCGIKADAPRGWGVVQNTSKAVNMAVVSLPNSRHGSYHSILLRGRRE
jgi:hypothetical protein